MSAGIDAAFTFTDLQGMASLRREAASDTPEARRAVAQQFEALFLNQMLKQMRDASSVIDGGLVDRERMRFHEDMLDQQMSLTLSRGRGIGLADSILRQLGGDDGQAARPVSSMGPVRLRGDHASALPEVASFRQPEARPGVNPLARTAAQRFAPETPEAFVSALWPHARRAAQRLGVPPDVLVAQAALETGWGQHMITDATGRSSHNLFGIKATGGWQGRQASVSTLEFINGVPERRREPFRVYASIAESFDDYVQIIENRPRYAPAREASTSADYARGLQKGGWATDPEYAAKIMSIVERGLPGVPVRSREASSSAANTASSPRDQVHTPAADNPPSALVAHVRAAAGDER